MVNADKSSWPPERHYDVTLPNGIKGKLMFAMGDLSETNIFAERARSLNARAFGLITFADLPNTPKHPMIWALTDTDMVTILEDTDDAPDADVLQLVTRYQAVFFDDIKDIAPELAVLNLRAKRTGDKSLN